MQQQLLLLQVVALLRVTWQCGPLLRLVAGASHLLLYLLLLLLLSLEVALVESLTRTEGVCADQGGFEALLLVPVGILGTGGGFAAAL